jgi:electron transport complex protein RnfG
MRHIIRMVVVLTLICAASGLTLSVVHRVTEAPIDYQTIKFVKEPAVKKVLTGYDNDPILDRKKIRIGTDDKGKPVELVVFPAKKNGETFAVAVEGVGKGFHGPIGVMVGVNKEEKLTGIAITTQSETPGIGSRVTEPSFTDRFKGLPARQDVTVDAISGATYSSRGVLSAVRQAVGYVNKFKKEMFTG